MEPTQEEYEEGLTRRQFVFEFDQETWKGGYVLAYFIFRALTRDVQHAIDAYDITECIVPARSKDLGVTKITGRKGWYG